MPDWLDDGGDPATPSLPLAVAIKPRPPAPVPSYVLAAQSDAMATPGPRRMVGSWTDPANKKAVFGTCF